ncbi:MAG TPA: outer membrane beta-barrel protein [Alphaproteobacteria bacterium]|nr:outer membrane beta-barrel protein [Alphaproteobacteria bacterium]
MGTGKRFWRIVSFLVAVGCVADAGRAFGQSASIATPQQEDVIFTSDVPAKQSQVGARPHADFSPIGLELGSMSIHAAVENDTQYNDNIFADQTHTADIIDDMKPRLDLAENAFDTAMSLSATADIGRYMIFHSENYEDYSITGTTSRDLNAESSIAVRGGTSRAHIPRTALNSPGRAYPVSYVQDNFVTIVPQYSTSPFIGTATIRGDYYQNQDVAGTDNSYLNYYALNVSNRFGYETGGGWTYFFQPSYEIDSYQHRVDLSGANHDKQVYQGLWGIQYDATADIYLELGLGYFYDAYFAKTQQNVGGLAELGSFVWNIDPLFSLTGSLTQTSQDLQGTLAAGIPQGLAVTNTGSLHLDYEAAYNVIAFVQAGLSQTDITGQGSNVTQESFPFSLGVSWYISEYLRAGAQYTFSATSASVATLNYDTNQIILTLVAQM